MADLTNQNKNSNIIYGGISKEINGELAGIASKLATAIAVASGFSKDLAPITNKLTMISILLEMGEDGPIKGLLSGAVSVGAGAFGLGFGVVTGIKENFETKNYLDFINIIMDAYNYSNEASNNTDKSVDKWCDDFVKFLQGQPTGDATSIDQEQSKDNISSFDRCLEDFIPLSNTLYGFVEQSVTQQNYRPNSDVILETDPHSEFLKGIGLSQQEYNNLFDWTNRVQELPQRPQYDNSMHNEFLQNIGMTQQEYENLFDFTNRVHVTEAQWASLYQTNSNIPDNVGTSNSIYIDKSFSEVNSSQTFTAGISKNATNADSQTQAGMLLGLGSAGFFFNPATAIVAVVGFIVNWLNSIFCRD